jgi:hypothetical protein
VVTQEGRSMNDLSLDLLLGDAGTEPLGGYPWRDLADKLILWSACRSESHRAFAFDLLMSLAYVDTIADIQNGFLHHEGLPEPFAFHLGFTNLCVPLLLERSQWIYHKAAKPQSGAIGKLTSEVILRFIQLVYPSFEKVRCIGGVDIADAALLHQDGRVILCEIKAAPLTTFPFLFSLPFKAWAGTPSSLTRTHVQGLESALYMHSEKVIPLGRVGGELWPFKGAVEFITESSNEEASGGFVETWTKIRAAYIDKNRDSSYYYVANACGHPPKIARDCFDWPGNESISDSKTSAGLDRTDDIKKGVYQTSKLSVEAVRKFPDALVKTALISNLPAYRHGRDYLEPFYDVCWGFDESFSEDVPGVVTCDKNKLRRPFDYIIALEDGFMRGDLL